MFFNTQPFFFFITHAGKCLPRSGIGVSPRIYWRNTMSKRPTPTPDAQPAENNHRSRTLLGLILYGLLYGLFFLMGKLWKFSRPLLRAAAENFLRATDPAPRSTVQAKRQSDVPVKPVPSEPRHVKKQDQPPVSLVPSDENPSDKGRLTPFTQLPILTEVDLEDDTPFGDIPFGAKTSSQAVIRPQ